MLLTRTTQEISVCPASVLQTSLEPGSSSGCVVVPTLLSAMHKPMRGVYPTALGEQQASASKVVAGLGCMRLHRANFLTGSPLIFLLLQSVLSILIPRCCSRIGQTMNSWAGR